jgi:invasion protein IalB
MFRRLALALILSPLVLAPALAQDAKPAAPAPVSSDPTTTTASFGDWTLRCQRLGEGDKAIKVCEIVQTMQATQGQQQQPVAQLAFGRIGKTDPWRITAHLPNNILLPSVVKVALSDKDPKPLELPWRRCAPVGCFADGALSEVQWKAFRAQSDNGTIEFTDSVNRPVKLPVSFRGFAQAADALAKE